MSPTGPNCPEAELSLTELSSYRREHVFRFNKNFDRKHTPCSLKVCVYVEETELRIDSTYPRPMLEYGGSISHFTNVPGYITLNKVRVKKRAEHVCR